MSETIREMVLPGTYIEVRAEGLIGVSGIATGNVGVVGTASRGPLDAAVVLGSYAEAVETFGAYNPWDPGAATPSLTLTRTLEQVFKGGASTVYAVRIANIAEGEEMAATTWTVRAVTPEGTEGPEVFQLVATSPGTWANDILRTEAATPGGRPTAVKLKVGRVEETFAAATVGELLDAVATSRFVRVEPIAGHPTAEERARAVHAIARTEEGGPDGASATGTEVAAGLELLASEPVHIVTIGGLAANDITDEALAHLEATENDGRERIAVIGASGVDLSTVRTDASRVGNPRLVLVAPGIVADDAASPGPDRAVDLTPPYAAALVAGRLSTLAPHISLTNKDVAAGGLTRRYTRSEQKQLLDNRVLVLQENLGIRVLKGITTDNGPFKQISVRRIVDYAKAGVRQGSNPYIGRLNNSRVRAALKATLDGFLSGMVLDEMLQSYDLDVSATRRQEIEGQAIVTLTLRPTFSIDFIKVIMNLE